MTYDRPLPVLLRPDLDHAREATMPLMAFEDVLDAERVLVVGSRLLPAKNSGPMRGRGSAVCIGSAIATSTRSKA